MAEEKSKAKQEIIKCVDLCSTALRAVNEVAKKDFDLFENTLLEIIRDAQSLDGNVEFCKWFLTSLATFRQCKTATVGNVVGVAVDKAIADGTLDRVAQSERSPK